MSLGPPTQDLDPDPDTLPHNWDSIWVPGYYQFEGHQYGWRPGYWTNPQPDRVWVPPHYRWTHHGYVFIAGYWDCPLEQRGMIFAPVYFWPGPHHRFKPSIVIEVGRLAECLFVHLVSHHYYFGDYFDEQVRRESGIYPWCGYRERPAHEWYDPLYAHHRAMRLRQDRQWEEHLRRDFEPCGGPPPARVPAWSGGASPRAGSAVTDHPRQAAAQDCHREQRRARADPLRHGERGPAPTHYQ